MRQKPRNVEEGLITRREITAGLGIGTCYFAGTDSFSLVSGEWLFPFQTADNGLYTCSIFRDV